MSRLIYTPTSVGKVSADWEVVPLKDCLTKLTNGFVGTSTVHQVEDGITYVQGWNVRPGHFDFSKKSFVSCEFFEAQAKAQLKVGDVLVVQSGHIGTATVVTGDILPASCHALIIARPDPAKLLPEFLCQYLNSWVGKARLRGLHVGSSILHINTSELGEFLMPVPSLREQQKIVEILSDCDSEILQMEQQLRSITQGYQSFCNTAWRLGGHSQPLKQIGKFFQGLAGKSAADFGKGERFVTYMGVFNGPYVKESGFGLVSVSPNETQTRLVDGDLLITMTSESKAEAGLTAIFRTDDVSENIFLNSFCAGFRLNEDSPYSPEILHALMQSSQFRAAIWRISQGSTRINLSRNELSKLALSLPEPDNALLLSDAVKDFAQQENQAKEALVKRRRFKSGLTQQLLTGGLQVRRAA